MNNEPDLEEFAPWLVALLAAAGGVLRALMLAYKGIWLDETVNLWIASHNLPEMVQWAARINGQPPLYYMLLHGWAAIRGTDPYALRFLSVLFSIGTIPLIYVIGKRLAGAVTGLAAAVLLTVSPFHLYFAQDTSMFALLTFNAAAAACALVCLLTNPDAALPIGSQLRAWIKEWRNLPPQTGIAADFHIQPDLSKLPRWRAWFHRHHWQPLQTISMDLAWLGYILFSAATLLSHSSGWLFLVSANIFVLGLMLVGRLKKSAPALHAPRLWDWVKAHIAIAVLWLPWLIPALKAYKAAPPACWIEAPTAASVLAVAKSFLNTSSAMPGNLALWVWILYGVTLVVGVIFLRKKLGSLLFLAALFIIPFALELLLSLRRPSFWSPTLLWTSLPLLILLAAGIAQLKYRWFILLGVGLFVTINVFSLGEYFTKYYREDWEGATDIVVGHFENGDLVLFNSNLGEIAFDYYFTPYVVRNHLQAVKQGLPSGLVESGSADAVMTADDVPALIEALQGHDRVWLVYYNPAHTDPQGLIPQTLVEQMELAGSREFYGGQVLFYVSP